MAAAAGGWRAPGAAAGGGGGVAGDAESYAVGPAALRAWAEAGQLGLGLGAGGGGAGGGRNAVVRSCCALAVLPGGRELLIAGEAGLLRWRMGP